MSGTEGAAETVRGWAREELERWPSFSMSGFRDACARSEVSYGLYAFEIEGNVVALRDKPYGHAALTSRAEVYLRHFRETLSHAPIRGRVTLLVDVEDLAEEKADYPVFSFQRRVGSRNLLVPDLDTLANGLYHGILPDKLDWIDKRSEAIFVGSTTGGGRITRQHLGEPFPRLRAARFFRDIPSVRFELPSIVQVDDPEVRAALLAEGHGGSSVDWCEQLHYKLLLSMDGNGAALSRPYIGLASNSALVKYASDHEAWYFRHLVPGIHYVPVDRDTEILRLIDGDIDQYESIARSGRAFAERYLTPIMYRTYTAELLRLYADRMEAGSTLPLRNGDEDTPMPRHGTTLEEIGFFLGTDKSRIEHDFLDFYEGELREFADRTFTLYEIGVFRGASLRTWAAWFDRATIVGLDIDPGTAGLDVPSNAHVRVGDAGSVDFLNAVEAEFGQPTIVIDDGSHRWHHQMLALHHFWPRIAPGGCFVMEDIHTSFPALAVEYRGLGLVSAYDYLVHLQRWVVGNRFMGEERAYDAWIERNWASVRSIHWMRGTAVVWKKG